MEDYKDLYFYLFNRLTDLSEEIVAVQNTVEEMYLEQKEKTEKESEN